MILLAAASGLTGVLVLLAALGATAALVEIAWRRRDASREPSWVTGFDALARSNRVPLAAVGGKAMHLARLVRVGAPVPHGVVLTSRFVGEIVGAGGPGKKVEGVWGALPAPARHELDAFLRASKGKLVVRASFTDPASKNSYAGVFPAVRDVPPEPDAVVAAVLALVGSADDAVAREYRKRRGSDGLLGRAVIVQEQLDADVIGTVSSRGPGGRADSVTFDVTRRRSPVRSYRYDLLDGRATPLVHDADFATPPWMHRMALLAVTLEETFGAAVAVDFAIDGREVSVLGANGRPAPDQKTWVHGAPLEASSERYATFAQELRGNVAVVREALREMLARAGAPAVVREEEVRYVEGAIYVDMEVLRRALARLGSDVLLSGGLLATMRAIAPVHERALPALPETTELGADAWQRLKTWHAEHLAPAARVRLELLARKWLIDELLRVLDPPGSGDRRGHPALRFLLARRAKECRAEAERQRTVLERAEAELGSAVARLVARGAVAWNAMFKGDRHLHASFEELDRWHADAPGRDALEAQWNARRKAFERRKDQPIAPRVHRPALADEASLDRGLGIVSGTATGPVVLVSGRDVRAKPGSVLVFADARAELCPHVYDAAGIVLLTGGLLSPVAALAGELGVPTVLAASARTLPAGRPATIDGTLGTIAR